MRHSGANCESVRLGGLIACATACVGLVLTGMSVSAQGPDKKAAKKAAAFAEMEKERQAQERQAKLEEARQQAGGQLPS